MLTKIITATLTGVEGYPVTVETDMHRGMPGFQIVGLADATIREACQRIRPAIMNSGYRFPQERVTVNLVPANRPKEGSHFDLPIALGVMTLGMDVVHGEDTAFLGEVSLDGNINPVRGVLPLAICLRAFGIKNIVVPFRNAEEAAILEDVNILPVKNLEDAVSYICGLLQIERYQGTNPTGNRKESRDFSEVMGQESVKRAILIGTAGNHGMLLMGGPGCGKTMMAKRIPTILPELTYEEKLEITGIYSVAGLLDRDCPVISERPFRSPHHTITTTGLIGGGARPKPGELSLAHRGVLFLDELGEFSSKVIDALRQPMEEGVIRLRRNTEEMAFPAQAMVVVASNPCKCGYLWDEKKICTCTAAQLASHRRKLIGPFADRIDMHIKVHPVRTVKLMELEGKMKWEDSETMRGKVKRARMRQAQRYKGTKYKFNSDLDEAGIKNYCILGEEGQNLMIRAYDKLGLSMRAYGKLLKIALTIADLDESDRIQEKHIAEALLYRVNTEEEN